MGCASELGQYLGDFLPCKHDGYPSRFPSMFEFSQFWERLFEDMTIEEDESLQRDILGGSRHLSLHGEMREKGADFWGTHVRRVALMMEENKALGPWHIRLFRPDTHSNYPNIVLVKNGARQSLLGGDGCERQKV